MAESKQECQCGFVSEGTAYRFCPECGSDLSHEGSTQGYANPSPQGKNMEGTYSIPTSPPISSPSRRLGAYIVEAFILFVVPLLLLSGETLAVFAFLGVWGWELWCWTQSRTIGKHLFGMTVVHKNTGQPFGFGAMFVREIIGKFISGFIFSLGFIWILIDDNNQGWHDKLISSIVIDG